MRTAFAATLACVWLCGTPAPAHATLVTNGGFEGPRITPAITAWSQSDDTGDQGVYTTFPGLAPHSGNQFAVFGDTGGPSYTLSQDIGLTVSGAQYVLTFYLRGLAGSTVNDLFAVSLGGTTLFSQAHMTASGDFDYQLRTYVVTAASTQAHTVLAFNLFNEEGYFALDDVSVTPVPEPGTLTLVGFAALAAAGWWRRSAAKRVK